MPDVLSTRFERDLVLVTGKGGVGKSTLVAAIARLATQKRGGAVAVEMSAHPRLKGLLTDEPRVETINIDLDTALPRALGRMLHIPTLLGAALNNRVLRLFARTAPASHEIILLDELYAITQRACQAGYPVVVDLPASGHAISLLRTPQAVQRMLRVGPVVQRARHIDQLLTDATRCEVVLVALPEELPVSETIELLDQLRGSGMHNSVIVVNQVSDCVVDACDEQLLGVLNEAGDQAVGSVARAVRCELASIEQARAQIQRLRRSAPDNCVLEVPFSSALGAEERTREVARTLASI